ERRRAALDRDRTATAPLVVATRGRVDGGRRRGLRRAAIPLLRPTRRGLTSAPRRRESSRQTNPEGGEMTKRELIDEVIKVYTRFSRRDAEVMVNAVFDSMTEALSRDERIEVRGFGSFVVKHRQAREGRNPKTGELVSVAAKR